ncbi:MAG: amino acid ABC transporter permease [Erysipelotrichales bacterium]
MDLLITVLPALLDGLKVTLKVFAISLVVSFPLGFVVALIRIYAPRVIGWIIQTYIFIMRGTPLLLQIMFVFFGLPFMGIRLERFDAALFALILNYTAYIAEIARGGIQAIPKNQNEAIAVLGIGRVRGFIRIIIPQVIKIILPALGNEVISLVKDTSLIYIIGFSELLRAGQSAANQFATPEPYIYVGVIYLMITAIITVILNKLEARYKED